MLKAIFSGIAQVSGDIEQKTFLGVGDDPAHQPQVDEESVEYGHQNERDPPPHRRPQRFGQKLCVDVENVRHAEDKDEPRHVCAKLQQYDRLRLPQGNYPPYHYCPENRILDYAHIAASPHAYLAAAAP